MAKCGEHSTAVLRVLCAAAAATDLDALVAETGIPRKKIINVLGRLSSAKLALRFAPVERKFGPQRATWWATDKGRALIASGGRVTSGPNGPHAAPANQTKDTFRARVWRALRVKGKATIPDLVEIASRPNDRAVKSNAQHYLRFLIAAGVAVRLPLRSPGFAPTSNGFARYALARDLGPRAPVATKKGLFDPNSGQHIPYREEK
jgi:hypothetical protein